MTTQQEHEGAVRPTFSQLLNDNELAQSLSKLNITQPTDVQVQAIPLALQGSDVIVQAQTGSGKTLAFMLPILARIRSQEFSRRTIALIVTPTRELALQVKAVVESFSPDIAPSCLIGGASADEQERQLRRDARIIVGTPGRLLDFIQQRLVILKDCSTFVLDEADEMLSMGFVDEVRRILSKLPKKRQGMFFSATITPSVSSLANSFLHEPQTIVVNNTKGSELKIEHHVCTVSGGVLAKVQVLCQLLTQFRDQSAIVFCNTKSDTELVEVFLRRRGFDARKINSDLSQRQRDSVLSALRTGELRYLIATDVAARGIDIKELDLVINYALPKEPEVYTHRTGRTGRAGASGRAISIVGPQDFGALYGLTRHRGEGMNEMSLSADNSSVAPAESAVATKAVA